MDQTKEIDHSKHPIYTWAVDDTRHKMMDKLQDIIKIQCSKGNWNYDPYMMGLGNGLIMAESIISGKEPKFLSAPKKWGKDYPSFWVKRMFVRGSGSMIIIGNIVVIQNVW